MNDAEDAKMLRMPQRPRLCLEPDDPDEYGRWEQRQEQEWGDYYSQLESLAERAVQHSANPQDESGRQKRNIEKFHKLPDLRWEEVTLTIDTTGDALIVQARGQRKRFQLASIGFADGRTGNRCSVLWVVLKRLADHGGELSHRFTNVEYAIRENLKKHVHRLKGLLQEIVGIEADPFFRRKTGNGYRLKCLIKDMAPDCYEYPDDRFMIGNVMPKNIAISEEEQREELRRLRRQERFDD